MSVDSATGAFTYTPTAGQRQAATNRTSDTFTVSVSNGAYSPRRGARLPVQRISRL